MTSMSRAHHIPAPLAQMLTNLGLTVPPSGKFHRGRLIGVLTRRKVANGRIVHLVGQLDAAGLLIR